MSKRAERPASPFSTDSFEPRFAIESFDFDALALALRLHVQSNMVTGWSHQPGASVFMGYPMGRARLAVAAQLHGFPSKPHKLRAVEPVFEFLTLDAAAEAVTRWLNETAEYPKQPWFDGGEARGFRVYHVPYGQPFDPYGHMVVEPKWFEIHK